MATVTNRIRGEVREARAAHEYCLNSPIFGEKRTPQSRYDFGDAATVGKNLKRSGLSFHELEDETDFGIYLGEHPDGWVVGIIDGPGTRLVAAEVFKTLGDLKQAWELD